MNFSIENNKELKYNEKKKKQSLKFLGYRGTTITVIRLVHLQRNLKEVPLRLFLHVDNISD